MRFTVSGVIAAFACAAAIPLGCRAVLGIEDREFDPTLADGGADSGESELSCSHYCDLIMSACVGAEKAQYASRDACLGLCSTFPKGSLSDTSGNTLGCRIGAAKSAVEPADCAAAGPGGNDVCGSNCESFCTSALVVCPQDFATKEECLSVCDGLPSCGTFSVDGGTPNNPSLQCRLFHVTSASIGQPSSGVMTQAQTTHCPHVAGQNECVVDAGAVCP